VHGEGYNLANPAPGTQGGKAACYQKLNPEGSSSGEKGILRWGKRAVIKKRRKVLNGAQEAVGKYCIVIINDGKVVIKKGKKKKKRGKTAGINKGQEGCAGGVDHFYRRNQGGKGRGGRAARNFRRALNLGGESSRTTQGVSVWQN